MVSGINQPETIVFFDLETTIPYRKGDPHYILEFGSITFCIQKLTELESFVTLVRPHDLSVISQNSMDVNGITPEDVLEMPTFAEIADKVYNILHGRVWMGHDILRFDCERLREAYVQIDRPPPEPKRIIDTLVLLTQKFGRRAKSMKLNTLAANFGLGQQRHRSLDDVRMNFEVVKDCATILFLESSMQDTFKENNGASLNAENGYHYNENATLEGSTSNTSPFTSNRNINNHTLPTNHTAQDEKMGPSVEKMESDHLPSNKAIVEDSSTNTLSDAFSDHAEFVEPDVVSMASITITIAPFFQGSPKMQILHRNIPMQIRCDDMRIRIGLSTQFVDHAGSSWLSFVIDADSSNLCCILDACDNIAKRFVGFDSNSEWKPVVTRNPAFYHSPTISLHIPTVAEDSTTWITELYEKKSPLSSSILPFASSFYVKAELDSLFCPGLLVDAYFSLDPYNYQQNTGIRLVAKKLIIHKY